VSSLEIEKEKVFEGGFKRTIFQTLWMAYEPYRRSLILSLAFGFIGRLLVLANTNMVGFWVDSITHPDHLPNFMKSWDPLHFVYGLLFLTGSGFSLTTFFRIRFSRISSRAVSSLYDETTMRISRAPMRFFDRNPVGRIMTRFSSDYGNVFRLFGGPLAEFFSILFDLVALVVLLTAVHGALFFLMLIYAAANLLAYKINRTKLREARRALSSQRGPSLAHFAETAQGAVSIRLFEKEKLFQNRFANLDQTYLDSRRKTVALALSYVFQMNFLSTLWFLVIGFYSWWGLQKGFMTVGDVGVSLGLILFSFNSVQMFFEWLTQIEEGFVGVERLDDYLRRPLENYMKLPSKAQYKTGHPQDNLADEVSRKQVQDPTFEIRFHDVSFRYGPELEWIFQDFNLTIPEGQKLGIIGRTGSGKSSLLQILSYLYPLDQGSVAIGANNPSMNGDLQSLRKSVAYLPQDPVIFKASLRDNLDLENLHSDAELIGSLKKVGLSPWFESIDQDLNYELQEKGKNISLGEKQLLGLARCLLQKAPIFILDEATSALDPSTENIVLNVLSQEYKGKTLLFVAHRLQTLNICDEILWLEKGKVKQKGPTQEVLSHFEKMNLHSRQV
jgi:ABC-type multidrug transport system fused ATPase/permease subunit